MELVTGSSRLDWSLTEIRSALAGHGSDADFSSVYRAVDALVADGFFRRIRFGRSESRFARAGAALDHARCTRCGTVVAVEKVAVEPPLDVVERQTGFLVSGQEVLFHGLCPACSRGS